MRQLCAVMVTILLLCGALTPTALAAEESPALADSGVSDTGVSTDTESSPNTGTDTAGDTGQGKGSNTDGDAVTDSKAAIGGDTVNDTNDSPDAVVLTRFDEPDRTDAVAFALGTSQEELSKWFGDSVAGFTGYDADGNPYDLISGSWSLESVNTGTVGVYYVSASPDLGTEYTLADGVSLPKQLCAVSIQTPGNPDINCCVSGRGFLHFPWILSEKQQEQLDQFAVWLQQDDGAQTQLSEGFLFTSDDLQLSQRIFKAGSTYHLRVSYPSGQTGVLSFQYDGEFLIVDYSGGDRDGGDVNGSGSSTNSQPAPTPTEAPSHSHDHDDDDIPTKVQNEPTFVQEEATTQPAPESTETPAEPMPTSDDLQAPIAPLELSPLLNSEPFTPETEYLTFAPMVKQISTLQNSTETVNYSQNDIQAQAELGNTPREATPSVQESYSPTETVISGLRLRNLCLGEESTVFGAGDLTASIPSRLLLALELSDSDTFSIKLTQPVRNQVTLEVSASGNSVTELPETVLRLRYTPQSKNSEITVCSESGEEVTDLIFEGDFLRFKVDTSGIYTISETSKSQSEESGMSPLLPLTGGGLLLTAGGVTLFLRKRHG